VRPMIREEQEERAVGIAPVQPVDRLVGRPVGRMLVLRAIPGHGDGRIAMRAVLVLVGERAVVGDTREPGRVIVVETRVGATPAGRCTARPCPPRRSSGSSGSSRRSIPAWYRRPR